MSIELLMDEYELGDLVYKKRAWWFADETGHLHGPFQELKEVEEARNKYATTGRYICEESET
jgi:hypothetical protein